MVRPPCNTFNRQIDAGGRHLTRYNSKRAAAFQTSGVDDLQRRLPVTRHSHVTAGQVKLNNLLRTDRYDHAAGEEKRNN
ncbi:MAG: hypothetical protein LBF90_03040 [Prevotellaceae bacterium]|nr:hypothetical protein [Prevotellaceae bacterium]